MKTTRAPQYTAQQLEDYVDVLAGRALEGKASFAELMVALEYAERAAHRSAAKLGEEFGS